MHRNPGILLAVCASALAIGLGACGDDDDDETTPASGITSEQASGGNGGGGSEAAAGGGSGGGEQVEITATEFKFDPSEVTTGAGEVTFTLRNDGSAEHNLEVEGNGVEEVSDTIGGGREHRAGGGPEARDLRDLLRDRRSQGPRHGRRAHGRVTTPARAGSPNPKGETGRGGLRPPRLLFGPGGPVSE